MGGKPLSCYILGSKIRCYAFMKFFLMPNILNANSVNQEGCLKASWLATPLGPILAIADEETLYLLEFEGTRGLEREIEGVRKKTQSEITLGRTKQIDLIKKELNLYFKGQLREFRTPISLPGTTFQRKAWKELTKISYGKTCSYLEMAVAMGRPTACRALAQANSCNQFAIMIPCHRVIHANGKLGGYAGGFARKEWLINHERSFLQPLNRSCSAF